MYEFRDNRLAGESILQVLENILLDISKDATSVL